MGRGREVAAHARWVDTAPRDCTSIRFGERVRAARRGGHVGSRRHWRPGWPLSLRLRLAAPAAPQTVAPDARSGSTQAALRRAQAEHSGSTQAAIMSNHEQSRALSRPTRSPHAVGVLGEGAAASSASDCLAIFPSCVPSRFVMANECLRWWRAVLGAAAQRQQRAFARALRNRWDKAAADKAAAEKAAAAKAAAEKAAVAKAAAEKAAAAKAAADKVAAAKAASDKATPLRMTPAVEEISALPKLRLEKPPRSCVDELRRPDLLPHVPAMADLLEDVSFKVQQLMYETLPVELPPDELFAVVAYTYDHQTGAQVCDRACIAPASRVHPD